MSLLYECINGIIQGGILDAEDNIQERDEVASLCVGKLRGMIVMDSDPNRETLLKYRCKSYMPNLTKTVKYVALLALNRIVMTHPMLVSLQQDVIMDCLEDGDVSIRLQALELVAGMVTSDSLQKVVNRLINQLHCASSDGHSPDATSPARLESGEVEDVRASSPKADIVTPLPNDYRTEVIHRILDICSQGNYSEIVDFEWYVDTLVKMVSLLPPLEVDEDWQTPLANHDTSRVTVAFRIGSEIRNVAVRVKGVRLEATRAAESLLLIDNRTIFFPAGSNVGNDILGPISWVVGEYAEYLRSPRRALQSLIDLSNVSLPPKTLQLFLQAAPKVFVQVTRACASKDSWRGEMSLLLAQVIEFLEALAAHPDLDVQERAIEFLEILRLGDEAMRSETPGVPFLLDSVIPGLFIGLELNPVAVGAQKKVVLPSSLQLDKAFNDDLPELFRRLDSTVTDAGVPSVSKDFYNVPEPVLPVSKPSRDLTSVELHTDASYQAVLGESTDFAPVADKRRAERKERYRDDPFYIAPEMSSGTSTPHDLPSASNGDTLDVDLIPIVDLKLDDGQQGRVSSGIPTGRRLPPRKLEVATDETLGPDEVPLHTGMIGASGGSTRSKRSLLQVDSSGLDHLAMADPKTRDSVSTTVESDAEMRKALQDVEKMRLRMQRASERIQLEGIPADGTLVKKKKKKKQSAARPQVDDIDSAELPRHKGKKKKKREAV